MRAVNVYATYATYANCAQLQVVRITTNRVRVDSQFEATYPVLSCELS